MTCIFCRRRHFANISRRVRDSAKHRVVKCLRCGLLQLSPTPTAEDDKTFYDEGRQFKNIGEPTALNRLRLNQQADTNRRAQMASKLLKPLGRVLDIGSGFGFFLAAMKKSGFQTEGIEVSRFARRVSKKVVASKVHNLDLFAKSLNKQYPLITLFHVLEHLARPVEFLQKIKPMLQKSGKLVIEVPSSQDALLAASTAYRDFYWQRAHVAYYDEKSLTKLIQRAGLKTFAQLYVQRYSLDNMMWWMIKGVPQLQNPSFNTRNYTWLETIYKNELIKRKQTDTLIIIAQLP